MQQQKNIKAYLDSLLSKVVKTDFDRYNLRLLDPSLLPKHSYDDLWYKEKNYKANSIRVDTVEECDAVRKKKVDACSNKNPGHNWMKDVKDNRSKNMCNSLIEYAYDKDNHKRYSDLHLILGLKKIRDGYMQCSNERTMFDKGVMHGNYADQCATFEKGYNSPEYIQHDMRVEKERKYAYECQQIITDVNNKMKEEQKLDELKKSPSRKSPGKSARKSPKKSPKKKDPPKTNADMVRAFPFEEMEALLVLLKRYKEEGKPLNQKLKGGVSLSFPVRYLSYDELRPIKDFLENAVQTPKDSSKLDMLITRVQNVIHKYRTKLDAVTLSFENLEGSRRRIPSKRRRNRSHRITKKGRRRSQTRCR